MNGCTLDGSQRCDEQRGLTMQNLLAADVQPQQNSVCGLVYNHFIRLFRYYDSSIIVLEYSQCRIQQPETAVFNTSNYRSTPVDTTITSIQKPAWNKIPYSLYSCLIANRLWRVMSTSQDPHSSARYQLPCMIYHIPYPPWEWLRHTVAYCITRYPVLIIQ
jgi:hypothetical protein